MARSDYDRERVREQARTDSKKNPPGALREIVFGEFRYNPPDDPEGKAVYNAEWERQTGQKT